MAGLVGARGKTILYTPSRVLRASEAEGMLTMGPWAANHTTLVESAGHGLAAAPRISYSLSVDLFGFDDDEENERK